MEQNLKQAYAMCLRLAKTHYENFPVVSCLLPHRQKLAIAAIYAFARTADDFADSDKFTIEEKLAVLNFFQRELDKIDCDLTSNHRNIGNNGIAHNTDNHANNNKLSSNKHISNNDPVKICKPLLNVQHKQIFTALMDSIAYYQLPNKLFQQLLAAFTQDVTKTRYQNFSEVLAYCELSANPVGQLLLHLSGNATNENVLYSNAICTGLQLINFMQDIYLDLTILDRCYLPVEEMTAYQVNLEQIKNKTSTPALDKFMTFQLNRIAEIYSQGTALTTNLHGRISFYLKLTIAGGAQILSALTKRKDHFSRPTLTSINKLQMLYSALRNTLPVSPYTQST